jgi:hypothetical protein
MNVHAAIEMDRRSGAEGEITPAMVATARPTTGVPQWLIGVNRAASSFANPSLATPIIGILMGAALPCKPRCGRSEAYREPFRHPRDRRIRQRVLPAL